MFLYKSPLSIWITCQFFFTNCQITIHYFLPYIYIYIYIFRQNHFLDLELLVFQNLLGWAVGRNANWSRAILVAKMARECYLRTQWHHLPDSFHKHIPLALTSSVDTWRLISLNVCRSQQTNQKFLFMKAELCG